MNRECRQLLEEYPIRISVPLLWGDEDAFGHVNNIIYLRWAETVRVKYLMRVGLWQWKRSDRIGPILASITCNFRRPLNYPDTIYAGARVVSIGNTSFRMEHRIVSATQKVLTADLDSTLVVFDYAAGKKARVPDEIRGAIQKLEGKKFP